MHEMINGSMPLHAIAMCVLVNVTLVLSIAALIKYLIKGRCGCGCCCKKQGSCGTGENNGSCCK
jgi:hypothetical protein